jgi:hypothetical protein
MYLKCLCGNVMTNVASPNDVEHVLLSDRVQERLQDLVDQEVSTNGKVDLWPEHWEEAGSIDVWKCPDCGRLYFNATGKVEDIVVYNIEKKGL